MPPIIVSPIELQSVWNRYAVMSRDFAVNGEGGGVLMRDALERHIESLKARRRERLSQDELTDVARELERSELMLRDLGLAQADGISYLPPELANLPQHLKRRASELLMFDDRNPAVGAITQTVIDRARARYANLTGTSSSALNAARIANDEIDELAEKMGLE
jgi:hypothetical protein